MDSCRPDHAGRGYFILDPEQLQRPEEKFTLIGKGTRSSIRHAWFQPANAAHQRMLDPIFAP